MTSLRLQPTEHRRRVLPDRLTGLRVDVVGELVSRVLERCRSARGRRSAVPATRPACWDRRRSRPSAPSRPTHALPSRICSRASIVQLAPVSRPPVMLSHSTITVPSNCFGSIGRYTTMRVVYGAVPCSDVPPAVVAERRRAGVPARGPRDEVLGLLVADAGEVEVRALHDDLAVASGDRSLDRRRRHRGVVVGVEVAAPARSGRQRRSPRRR